MASASLGFRQNLLAVLRHFNEDKARSNGQSEASLLLTSLCLCRTSVNIGIRKSYSPSGIATRRWAVDVRISLIFLVRHKQRLVNNKDASDCPLDLAASSLKWRRTASRFWRNPSEALG